jgi:hypothetical protein
MEDASGILSHSIPLPFWPRWIRCNVNLVENHPAMSDFPHAEFADLQLERVK